MGVSKVGGGSSALKGLGSSKSVGSASKAKAKPSSAAKKTAKPSAKGDSYAKAKGSGSRSKSSRVGDVKKKDKASFKAGASGKKADARPGKKADAKADKAAKEPKAASLMDKMGKGVAADASYKDRRADIEDKKSGAKWLHDRLNDVGDGLGKVLPKPVAEPAKRLLDGVGQFGEDAVNKVDELLEKARKDPGKALPGRDIDPNDPEGSLERRQAEGE